MMKKLNIKYRGPIKGRLRVFFHKKDIQKRFGEMIKLAGSTINLLEHIDGVTDKEIENVCYNTTNLYDNPYKMYIFMGDDGLHFGFFDCGMKDHGEFMIA